MVKYIGSDKSTPANDTFRAPSLTPNTLNGSSKSIQFVGQQQQQLGESLKGSLQFQSQTAARMSEDFSRTSQVTQQVAAQTAQSESRNNNFSQALSTLANVGNTVAQTLERNDERQRQLVAQEQKNYEAQQKAVRDSNAASMWERVSKWETSAAEVARLDPGGTVTLRNQVQEMFNTTEGADLSPEDRQQLMKHTYGNVIAGLASKNVEDLMTQQRKVAETNVNTRKETAIFESSTLLSALGSATTPDEQATSIAKLSEYLGKIATSNDLDPMSKAEIRNGMVVAMNKAMFTSEENRIKANEVIENYQQFQRDVAIARQQYPNDIEAQETAIAYSSHANKIPVSIAERFSITKAQERAVQLMQLNNTERGLRDEEVARNVGAPGSDFEAGYFAEQFNSDVSLEQLAANLGNGDAKLGRETPRYRQIVAAQKARKNFTEITEAANTELAKLNTRKQEVAKYDVSANLAYLKTLQPSPQTATLIQRLQIATGNNPALAQFLPMIGQYQQLDDQRKQQYDQMYAAAVAQGFNANAAIIDAIDIEARVIHNKLKTASDEIGKYGWNAKGEYVPSIAKDIEAKLAKQEAERLLRYQQQQQESMSGGGGTYDAAPFDSVSGGSSYFNGLEVFYETQGLVLPITKTELKRQGAPNINEGVGWRAWANRNHNGQDIGVDPRTPIVAQLPGKVIQNTNAGTAGNFVEIAYADGSTHVFMHLYDRPNLAVGQTIRPGQVIGHAGNTGLAGGNANAQNTHLHWEVYYGDKLSTPQEWSAKYKQNASRRASQPRAGGPGASVTSPTRGAHGVPIKGGLLVPDGKGGATVTGYNKKPPTPQYFTSADIVATPAKVDKTRAGQLLIQRTGMKGPEGLEYLVATLYDKQGNKAAEHVVNSGSPVMQSTFGEQARTQADTNAPLPFGTYSIGRAVDAYDVPSMQSQFIPIEPGFDTKRSALGIHFDGDRDVKPGSAGCIVFPNKARFDEFNQLIKQHDIRTLNFPSEIRDNGQQKTRKPVPPRTQQGVSSPRTQQGVSSTPASKLDESAGGRILYGPGGSRFQRNADGNLVLMPRQETTANYTNTNPVRRLTSSNRAVDYNIGDVANDHGFAPLKKNPAAARAINEVAKSFGVPGEWLAEVISVETDNTFRTDIKEYGGSGATGLIQFYPDVDGGTTKTINGKVYNLNDIGRMNIVQQLRGPVKDYLTEAMRANGMTKVPTIQDLYGLVYAYGPASKARKMRDQRGASGDEILSRLGKFSGRRYATTNTNVSTNIARADTHNSERASRLTKRVDKRPVAGCVTCQQMTAVAMFVPHERVNLNTGMELFNLA